MKITTPYLFKFALTATVLTIIFRYFLSYGIGHQSYAIISTAAVLYGVAMFLSGWYWGKKDGEYLPIYDIGFRFHLTTYIVHIGISLLWIALGFGSKYEQLDLVVFVGLCWGAIVLLHFFFFLWARKNSINNLNKKDLFD